MAYSAGQLISMSVDSQGQAWGISYGTSPGWHQTIDMHRSITLRPERQGSDWGLVGSLTVYRAGRSGTLEHNTLEKSIEPRYPLPLHGHVRSKYGSAGGRRSVGALLLGVRLELSVYGG